MYTPATDDYTPEYADTMPCIMCDEICEADAVPLNSTHYGICAECSAAYHRASQAELDAYEADMQATDFSAWLTN